MRAMIGLLFALSLPGQASACLHGVCHDEWTVFNAMAHNFAETSCTDRADVSSLDREFSLATDVYYDAALSFVMKHTDDASELNYDGWPGRAEEARILVGVDAIVECLYAHMATTDTWAEGAKKFRAKYFTDEIRAQMRAGAREQI